MFNHIRRACKSVRKAARKVRSHIHFPRLVFNGAEDIICVQHQNGYVKSSGWYVSMSRLSSENYGERDSDVKIKINGTELSGFSIKLRQISRGTGRNDVGVPIHSPTYGQILWIFKFLQEGCNKITFYLEDQPNASIDARIYRWRWDSKIVVVDLDGTITRSEIGGIYRCFTEEHYLHPGVSKFLLYLKALGYKLIFLTARPISTINSTRKYLADNFNQLYGEDFRKVPDGPVFTSCDGRIRTTFNYARVATGLEGTSHDDFKSDFLARIRELFYGTGENPLCVGIGNTQADTASYRKAGIPEDKIFQVLSEGNITHCYQRFPSFGDLLTWSRAVRFFPCVGFSGWFDDFFGNVQDFSINNLLNWIRHAMFPWR